MNVTLQTLKEFTKRTEYKVLKEWYEVTETDIYALQPGICIVPGIILSKAGDEQLAALVQWAREWGNHLLLIAPWWQAGLADYLDLPVGIEVDEKKSEYQGISISHVLITKLPPVWQGKKGDTLAVSLRYHSGSGVLTLTTVPLLDYKLTAQRSACRSLLDELLSREIMPGSEELPDNEVVLHDLTEEHLMVLLLAAGGVNIHDDLAAKVRQYATVNIAGKEAALQQELWQAGLLDAAGIATEEGVKILVKRGYRSFIRELRKQGDVDAW